MVVLLVSDMGSYIGKEKGRFKISYGMSDKPVTFVPSNRVEGVIIDAKTTISSGAFELLANEGIPVIWNDYQNDGMILLPYNAHGSVEVRKEQFRAIEDERGIAIATKISYAACHNKLFTLQRISRNWPKLSSDLEYFSNEITDILNDFAKDTDEYSRLDLSLRQKLMSTEAKVAKVYYQAVQSILQINNWGFDRRSRRPAEDPFNAMLNYCYAILKGQLTHRVHITGLDIFAGFLHTDRSGRESLVLDIIEEFRQVCVDEVLLQLVSNNTLQEDMFEEDKDGITITKEVKKIMIPAIFDRFKMKIRSKKIEKWFLYQPRAMVRYLRGVTTKYSPFMLRRKDPW